MNWQCRLYGHQWRHPGEYEVVLLEDTVPAYPFQCAVCDAEMLRGPDGTDLRPDLPESPSLDVESKPELETGSEPELDGESDLTDE